MKLGEILEQLELSEEEKISILSDISAEMRKSIILTNVDIIKVDEYIGI